MDLDSITDMDDALTFKLRSQNASLHANPNDSGFMRKEERPNSTTTAMLCNETFESQHQMTNKYINLADIEPPYQHRVTFNFPRCLS